MMKCRCMECDRFMGYVNGPDFEVTTGICPECKEKEDAKKDRAMIRKYNLKVVEQVMDAVNLPRRGA